MEEIKKLTLPLTGEQIKDLHVGDKVELSGVMMYSNVLKASCVSS